MRPTPAPFFDDVAKAPAGAKAVWLDTEDGVRIRVAHWRCGTKGTVLIFPGRSEYIEKYGPAAGDLALRGYATVTVDWRGQGLADRLLADRALGHVGAFLDYQKDVAALMDFVAAEKLPQPCFLIAHSMGGCIALRALHDGLPVRAVAFSAPMWGIRMMPVLRPVAWAVSGLAPFIGMADRLVPGTSAETYVIDAPFEGNVLTRDADMFEFMRHQQIEHPDLAIGGPTLRWLHEALNETRALARMPSPDMGGVTILGSQERVVNVAAIHRRMAQWPNAQLHIIDGAEHEPMMDSPTLRAEFFDRAAACFESAQVKQISV
ncbi:MAG: alpha/beta hydrolase [Albidovulum sp.]